MFSMKNFITLKKLMFVAAAFCCHALLIGAPIKEADSADKTVVKKAEPKKKVVAKKKVASKKKAVKKAPLKKAGAKKVTPKKMVKKPGKSVKKMPLKKGVQMKRKPVAPKKVDIKTLQTDVQKSLEEQLKHLDEKKAKIMEKLDLVKNIPAEANKKKIADMMTKEKEDAKKVMTAELDKITKTISATSDKAKKSMLEKRKQAMVKKQTAFNKAKLNTTEMSFLKNIMTDHKRWQMKKGIMPKKAPVLVEKKDVKKEMKKEDKKETATPVASKIVNEKKVEEKAAVPATSKVDEEKKAAAAIEAAM